MDSSLLFVLGFGFLLGLKHATEADHVVAVTTIVSEQKSIWRSALVGAWWGVGHTATLFVIGAIILLLRVQIPDRIATSLELIVAVMIILLGARVLYSVLRGRGQAHLHHDHQHTPASLRRAAPGVSGWRSVFVGAVHGLAGSAALTLFILTELSVSLVFGVAYLILFGLGSIGGMFLMSALVSLPFVFSLRKFERFNTHIRFIAGVLSIAFGLFYLWEKVGEL